MRHLRKFSPFFFLLLAAIFVGACTSRTADRAAAPADQATEKMAGQPAPADSQAPEATPDDATPEANNATAQTEPQSIFDAPVPEDPAVRTGMLENGLTYYIRQNGKPEDRVEVRLALKAGSILEDEDQLGLAHFIEHMAFNGTENFEKSALVDYLESIGTKFGADLNAYTSFDETVYMLQLRTDEPEMVDKGLLVMQDWAGGVSFDHEEIDKERGVVVSEWRSSLSADQRMMNQYLPVMLYGSRYAERLPIGDPEIIKTADYETVKRFYRDWYRPDLMALSIVGDIDVDEMEQMIRERFASLSTPADARDRTRFDVPSHTETLVSVVSDEEAAFTRVNLMYKHDHLPTETMGDYRRNMVYRLYDRMINARLEELTQSANPPFLFANTSYGQQFGDLDAYSSNAFAQEGGAIDALKAVLMENERVLRFGFTQSELDRQKIELMNGMEKAYNERDKTESGRLVMRYVYSFLNNTPYPSIENEYQFYQALLPTIALDEVNALPQQWIIDTNRVVIITGPEKEGVPLPTEAAIRATLDEVKSLDLEPYTDEASDEPLLGAELSVQPLVGEESMDDFGITRLTFGNGVTVYLKPTDFKNDQILMSATSWGGHSLYSDEDYFEAAQASGIIGQSGVGNFDQIALQKKLAGKTLELSPYIGELEEGMQGSCSPKDLETFLQLVYLYFTEPRRDEESFQSFVNRNKTIYQNIMMNPQYWFLAQTLEVKYGNNPRYSFPGADDFESISLDRAMDIYRERFANAGDFTFYFVGAFDVENMKNMLGRYLGNLPGEETGEQYNDLGINMVDGRVTKNFNRGQAPKAQVEMTFHGDFEWTGENRYNFESMVDVLSIKMRESMREDKGGVYGVRVSGSVNQFPTPEYTITISFNAEPDQAEDLIATALNDIANAQENGAEEKDLIKVKETQRQERIKALKENRFWLSSLEYCMTNGIDLESLTLEALEKRLEGLTSEDVKRAATRYFDTENYIELVMYPEEQ